MKRQQKGVQKWMWSWNIRGSHFYSIYSVLRTLCPGCRSTWSGSAPGTRSTGGTRPAASPTSRTRPGPGCRAPGPVCPHLSPAPPPTSARARTCSHTPGPRGPGHFGQWWSHWSPQMSSWLWSWNIRGSHFYSIHSRMLKIGLGSMII